MDSKKTNMIAVMFMDLFAKLRRMVGTERAFDTGASLFHQGDSVSVLHLVVHGETNLVRYQRPGTALVLQRAGPGTILAEASLFSERYHCDGIAVMATSTHAIPRAAVRARLADDPEFAEICAEHLAHALQATRLRAEILSLRTVGERLDAWLAWHDGCVPARGTWKTVASEIGTSPEALYRELAKRRTA